MKRKNHFFTREIKHFSSIRANQIFFVFLILLIAFLAYFSKLDTHPGNFTWIYSTSMQVLGALIALLPISYSFYLANIDKTKNEELDSYVLETLKKDGYHELMFVVTVSVLTIVINLVFFFLEDREVYALIAAFFSLLSIQLVSIFIYQLFDPERANIILKQFDVPTEYDPTHKRVTLDEFIKEYKSLEIIVKDFISKDGNHEKLGKMTFFDVVDTYSKDFKLIQMYSEDFKEIIFHRNNVTANSSDVMVDYTKYVKIVGLIKEFDKANEQFVAVRIFANVSSVRNKIDDALNEYLDAYNNGREADLIPRNYQRKLAGILVNQFNSKYYNKQVFAKGATTDLEIVQKNFSKRKLVGIDFKLLDSNRFNSVSKSLFRKLQDEYMYIFTINFNIEHSVFEVAYLTKDHKMSFYIK